MRWFTPLIQGYIGIADGELMGRELKVALISRRSINRSGTRFNARGIDDNGHTANFVETEQIVQSENLVMSYVMVRGSVPIFWDQKGMIEDITYPKSSELTARPFRLHFEELVSTYGEICIIDLLSDTTRRELPLTKEYLKQLHDAPLPLKQHLSFQHYDFHGFCKGDKYHQLKVLLSRLAPYQFGYHLEDLKGRKIFKRQTGAFRVNCLDSLDRTNVAQSMIGVHIFQQQLQTLGFRLEELLGDQVIQDGIAFMDVTNIAPIIQSLKQFWSE